MKFIDEDMLKNLKENQKITDGNVELPSVALNDFEKRILQSQEYDEAKTRVLKYILFKKRSEREVRDKFKKMYNEELLDLIIKDLKEKEYINDNIYLNKTINEIMKLKTFSIFEIRYKIIQKGLHESEIEKYFNENDLQLNEYEINSAIKIINIKKRSKDETQIKNYLFRRGFKKENVIKAFENITI